MTSDPKHPERTGHARVALTTASAAGRLMLWAGSHLAKTSSLVDTTSLSTLLRTQLQFSNSELSALTRGQPVVKTLPPTMSREMTTAGAVRIRSGAMARFVDQFKTLEGFKTSQFVLQIQKFGDPPQLSELDALIVDAEDVESLRECRVGACDVQLAADDINRLRAEVNWRSPTAAQDATALYKAILFAHLTKVSDRRQRSARPLPGSRDGRPTGGRNRRASRRQAVAAGPGPGAAGSPSTLPRRSGRDD